MYSVRVQFRALSVVAESIHEHLCLYTRHKVFSLVLHMIGPLPQAPFLLSSWPDGMSFEIPENRIMKVSQEGRGYPCDKSLA